MGKLRTNAQATPGTLLFTMDIKQEQTTLFNPTESKEINTVNLEQTAPLVEKTLGPTHRTLSTPKSESISDPGSISTTTLFTKPYVFAPNIDWDVTDVTNTVLYDNSLLAIFQTLERSPGGQALRANTFFRSGARVQLKLSSSPFHSGKLVFYYIPPGVDATFRESIYAKVQYPCVYVDAANSTTAELNIPFVAIKDFFATYNPDRLSDFGQIQVAVLNPLAIGTGGPPSVTFALSLHPTENQIALPVLAHTIDLQAAVAAAAYDLEKMVEPIVDTAEAWFDSEPKHIQAAKNNLDKPNLNNVTSTKDLNISAPSLSNMASMGTEHLSLFPEATFVHDPNDHSPFDDEMDILRISKIPSLLAQGSWTSTDDPQTLLQLLPIDPMAIPAIANGQQRITYPTYLSHCSLPFVYWRGSIDFHFTFASTPQHRGKVIVAWIPYDVIRAGVSGILGEDGATIESLSLFPNEIFDLSLNKEFSFSVPYNTETPYRLVNNNYNQVRADVQPPRGNEMDQQNSLGTLVMMIYNKLSHPETVTNNVAFNSYISAGNDFQLRALKYNRSGNSYENPNFVELQGMTVAMESSRGGMLHENDNRVGINSAYIKSTSYQHDNSEHNLCKLLSKYYPQIGFSFTVDPNNAREVLVASKPGLLMRSPRVGANLDPQWRNLISHFRDIYAFWHGSLNYFVIHNTTVNTPLLVTVTHEPNSDADVNQLIPPSATDQNPTYVTVETFERARINYGATSAYSHMSNLRVNPTLEVSTPYRSIYRRLYTKSNALGANDYTDLTESNGVLAFNYSNPSATEIPVSAFIFQSVGSDFRFKYLIPPPSIQIAN